MNRREETKQGQEKEMEKGKLRDHSKEKEKGQKDHSKMEKGKASKTFQNPNILTSMLAKRFITMRNIPATPETLECQMFLKLCVS